MTTPSRRMKPIVILVVLLALVLAAVLIAPASESGGSLSSHSTGPSGARLGFDLANRFGWRTERRDTPFADSVAGPAPIQVLLSARVAAPEAHALLEHVRRGGGLLVAGDAGALTDSLPVTSADDEGDPVAQPRSADCQAIPAWESQLERFRTLSVVAWRRPAPMDTVGFGEVRVERGRRRAAVGYPMGAGRVVVVPDTGFVINDMIRRCAYEADVAFLTMLDYLSNGRRDARVAWDEYHHGYGVHGGGFKAIRMYLAGTGSGRMLGQIVIAGLLLLLAAAPRPLDPRDPARVVRRSPLEHADALAHAYAGVHATRTVTARLLGGARRRTRRDRGRHHRSDEELLSAASAASPQAAAAAAIVGRALATPVPDRDLAGVAAAISTIESALTDRPTPPTR